jgi:tetratricopeptide (TPR) repeat protein
MIPPAASLALILFVAPLVAGAQENAIPSSSASRVSAPADSVPLYRDLGSYSRRITTTSPVAQQYFDQGMRLTYGFGHPEARRAFREAIRRDSTCAMCHWGLAWSLGPYINAQMDSASGVEAHAAAQRARRLANRATAIERALIEAMAARYAAVPTAKNRPGLDTAYVVAMRDVVRRFPNDLDAAALLGEALMVLRPWDQWTRTGEPKPGTEEVIAVLESVLRRDLRHPGACHHYIHATEASRDAGRAARCADLLGDVIPGASHVPHMPSHTYMRIGRYGDAVRANQRAWHADQRAAYGSAPGIYPPHNLQMLMSAAAMDGQSAVSIQAARDLARAFPSRAFYPLAVLVRFGRWHETLEMPPLTRGRLHAGVGYFARGVAHLGLGRADSARAHLELLDAVYAAVPDSLRFEQHPQRSLLGIARAILAGELAASAGRYDEAITVLRAALPLEDSLAYDEPEPWPIPLRHALGAVLLEAKRPAEAEAAYRQDLAVHPNNGWALAGLEQALRAQGRAADADEVARRFATAWQRADVWLRGSRMPPRPPAPGHARAAEHH